jgi:lysophospholipase L1-like esterase
MTTLRICFIGDSITAGTCDDQAMGWPARLCATEITNNGHDISSYNLGIRAETSSQIAARWQNEAAPRLPEHVDGKLVFMFGVNDMAIENETISQTKTRVSIAQSLINAKDMMEAATAFSKTPPLWLGNTPLYSGGSTISPGLGISYSFSASRNSELNTAYEDLATQIGVDFLNLHYILDKDQAWDNMMKMGDGVHPTKKGYEKLAKVITNWPAWRAWFA